MFKTQLPRTDKKFQDKTLKPTCFMGQLQGLNIR
jgi:hypothetical protein